MNIENALNRISQLDLHVYKHASNIRAKCLKYKSLNDSQRQALPMIVDEYFAFIDVNNRLFGYSNDIVKKRTDLLNRYYDYLDQKGYYNIFSSQSKFRSTILEEFMYILFRDLIIEASQNILNASDLLKLGSARAYTNLFFSGANFSEFIKSPDIGINQKDQDFAIYRPIEISIGDSNAVRTNLPVVAIENKTYIDKTMLEGSISTAEKIKSGNPYSLFFIVTENYQVDLKIDPIYSKIDQIYVLRKTVREKSNSTNPIFPDVLCDLVQNVKQHLNRHWSDVKSKLTETGKII